MGKLKKIDDRFYFLIQELSEKSRLKRFEWDSNKKVYFTYDFYQAYNLKKYACDESTRMYLESLENAVKSSYSESNSTGVYFQDILDYQNSGVNEMLIRLKKYNCVLLSDEQGLGKTAQVIKLLIALVVHNKILIACPSSLKFNWKAELHKWGVDIPALLNIQILKSSKDVIKNESSVILVSYDLLSKSNIQSQIFKLPIDICICDEAHYLKNISSSRTKSVMKIMNHVKYRVGLTGTPVLNRPIEIYSLLKCLKAHTICLKPFEDFRSYSFRFCNAFIGNWGLDNTGSDNLEELNFRLRSTIMIRREKKQVLYQLPEKFYQIIALESDKVSKSICQNMANLFDSNYQLIKKPELESVGELAKLRQELALSKINDCISYVKQLLETNNKVVLFAYHKVIISKLKDELKNYTPVVFDGSVSSVGKNLAVKMFQNDPKCRIFIGQITAAGVGITLTASDTVVFVESSWVPGEIEQAADRCHRIGQKNNVMVQFLTVEGSIDEYMLQSVVNKLSIINRVVK